jgi:hypothetical protein
MMMTNNYNDDGDDNDDDYDQLKSISYQKII